MNGTKMNKQPRCEPREKAAEQFTFKVTVNNAGEILTFYTAATTPSTAKRNAFYQLAKKLGHNPHALTARLKDRASVELANLTPASKWAEHKAAEWDKVRRLEEVR